MARIEAFGRSFETDNITQTHKIIAGAVIALIILGAGTYYMLYPQWSQLKALESEIAEQETKIATKETQVKKLPLLKKELAEIEKNLVLLRRKIPHDPRVAPLLVDIEEITENQALYGNAAVLNEFKPAGIVDFTLPAELQDASSSETAKQLKQLPVNIALSNVSFPDLIKLLSDYESYERTLGIESLTITPRDDQNALYTPIDVSFTLKAFLLSGESK